jgi:hypothetical protein
MVDSIVNGLQLPTWYTPGVQYASVDAAAVRLVTTHTVDHLPCAMPVLAQPQRTMPPTCWP